MFEDIRFAPLHGSMLVAGMLGFIFTVIYSERIGLSWSFTLGLFCLILCIASFLSLQYAPIIDKEAR